MLKKLPNFESLPYVIDKDYQTKFQTGEWVTLKKIHYNSKNEITMFGVIYHNAPHLGVCPLGGDRLISEKKIIGEIIVCPHCNNEINE